MATNRPAVIFDNGTSWSKIGFAGQGLPLHNIPTVVGHKSDHVTGANGTLSDLDFVIGNEALEKKLEYSLNYPITDGIVTNWDMMEKFWQASFFDMMRVEPENHGVVVTESPLNPPENREYTAEIMFETFNVPHLYIGVQATMALCAKKAITDEQGNALTGVVVDSGDGGTQIVPVVEGFVVGSAIRTIPLGGKNVTSFIQETLRKREGIPLQGSESCALQVKENHCYVARDLVHGFNLFDSKPEKYITNVVHEFPNKGKIAFDVGYEAFIGPEMFFMPEIFNAKLDKPLAVLVDEAIQACPMQSRIDLYGNVVLCGGNTSFKNFKKRLEGDIQTIVDDRMKSMAVRMSIAEEDVRKINVNVFCKRNLQQIAVFLGASEFANDPAFYSVCHTKEQYEEQGSSVARFNAVFRQF
ncbi:hypothetical protein PCE1_001121 [Barthelona sp. PCE]